MKVDDTSPIYNAINTGYVNEVIPIVTAEWNHNRFYRTLVDNTPTEDSEGYDTEMFPIESIVEPDRPVTRGIAKAMVNESLVSGNEYRGVPGQRYYTASVEDIYKYWQSPKRSAASEPYNITDCAPHVLYVEEDDVDDLPVNREVYTNKVHILFESTWAEPDAYDIQIQTLSSGWVTIASDIPPYNDNLNDGLVELYYIGGDPTLPASWQSTKPDTLTEYTSIHGIRIVVTSIKPSGWVNLRQQAGDWEFDGGHLSLIELGLRLHLDVSDDVISVSDDFNLGEQDFITPLGTVSSNTGNITLWSGQDQRWDNDNPSSTFYGLLDKGVKFDLKYRYLNGGSVLGDIQQFVMFSDDWNETREETTVSLVDGSRRLQEIKPPQVLYGTEELFGDEDETGIAVQEAVWRLCDTIGFNNYVVESVDYSETATIDIFWTDGQQTIWEVFQDLSRGTQTAIYFDNYGRLRIRTREHAFDNTKDPVWTLRENQDGDSLENIAELAEQDIYEANKVKVNFHPTKFSEKKGNITPMEVVWEPEGTVALRATPIMRNLEQGMLVVKFPVKESRTWPFKGTMQIEGEWIEYEGKHYVYHDGATKKSKYVKSMGEKRSLDDLSHPRKKHLNGFTGYIRITRRGSRNTSEEGHFKRMVGFKSRRIWNYKNPGNHPVKGRKRNAKDSSVTLRTDRSKKSFQNYFYVHRQHDPGKSWRRIGTKMKIDKSSHKHKTAGIWFQGDAFSSGYYVEFMATARMSGKMRKVRNELVFYSMKQNGSKKRFGGQRVVSKNKGSGNSKKGKTKKDMGRRMAIVQDRYFEVDIFVNTDQPDHHIRVFVNGRLAINAVVPNGSGWKQQDNGRFGMYVRGQTKATFEYLYAINRPERLRNELARYMDRIKDGYFAQAWFQDYVYEAFQPRPKRFRHQGRVASWYQDQYYTDFGPYAHEIREFDVKFDTDNRPVLHSKLYKSNHQSWLIDTQHHITGARFTIANAARHNVILHGEDTLTAKGQDSIEQKLFVFGRPVLVKDAGTVERKDDWGIRRRGVIETEYDSKWLQNKDSARKLANWLARHWTRSEAQLQVEVFGNPLLELGDIVDVDYQNMSPATHQYFVTGIVTSFERELTTSLTLRRVTRDTLEETQQ